MIAKYGTYAARCDVAVLIIHISQTETITCRTPRANWNVIGSGANRGGTGVPEPSSRLLLGSGLMGLDGPLKSRVERPGFFACVPSMFDSLEVKALYST
jgi:hypothetical protein